MTKSFLFLAFFSLSISSVYAQETCKIQVDELKGSYTGDCKDGKANGQGKATGTDTYEGSFKNGYPDGYGTYTWANKDVYSGNFKKGAMDGQGTMRYFGRQTADSVLVGFWKKNKYIGQYEKPFVVNDRTSKVNKVEVMLIRRDEKSGSININSEQLKGQSFSAMPVIPTVTDISVVSGQFISKNSSTLTASSVTRIQQIIFPFRARISFSNGEMVEITFNEKADYDVNIAFL